MTELEIKEARKIGVEYREYLQSIDLGRATKEDIETIPYKKYVSAETLPVLAELLIRKYGFDDQIDNAKKFVKALVEEEQ